MTNSFDRLNSSVQELHHRAGYDGTVYNDAQTAPSSDWVERSAETDDFDSGTAITIRIEAGNQPEQVRDASGREVTGDVVIIVDPTEATFTAGDEETRASEIVDERNGDRYRVLQRLDENTGVLRLDAERLT